MIIHSYTKKSKPKKSPKHIREQYAEWLVNINKPVPKFSRSNSTVSKKTVPSPKIPPGRESPQIQSLNTGFVPCTKPVSGNSYTGTKMLGIGTLHKSNAVPVFNDNEAKEMARMRRG
jgi:hypothetical protein